MAKDPTEQTNRRRIEPIANSDQPDDYELRLSLAISAKRIADKLDEIEKTLNSIYMDMPSG